MPELDGKVALITGGARGIGQGCAAALAEAGADIAVCDLAPDSDETRSIVEAAGRRALHYQADIGDRPSVEALFDALARDFPTLDILVNNAAFSIRKPLIDLEVGDVEKTWRTTLWGAFHCSQLAARRMVAQGRGGNIVVISSVHAVMPFPRSTAYNAAKAGVNAMARTWAVELAANGIRVNVIEPGWIDTPGERQFYTEEQIQDEGRKLLLGRLGQPRDIGEAVRYLVSPAASYVTGTVLRVDGGIVLPKPLV